MNRFSALALAAAMLTPIAAHADGHWVDARHHMSLENVSDGSDAAGRLGYAKDVCYAKTGTVKGTIHAPNAAWDACMHAQGYVYRWDSPAQVAANRKAVQDAQNRAQRYAVGQALSGIADDLNRELNRPQPQPQNCNGFIYRGGYVDMNCN